MEREDANLGDCGGLSFCHDTSSSVFSDDDMVEDADADEFSDFGESIGNGDIFAAGGRVTGGVIVSEYDCRCAVTDSESKDFSWVNEAGVEGTDGDAVRGDGAVLGIEGHDMKFFLEAIGGESCESFEAESDCVVGATDTFGCWGGDIALDGDATSEFDTGHNLAVAIAANGFADGA